MASWAGFRRLMRIPEREASAPVVAETSNRRSDDRKIDWSGALQDSSKSVASAVLESPDHGDEVDVGDDSGMFPGSIVTVGPLRSAGDDPRAEIKVGAVTIKSFKGPK